MSPSTPPKEWTGITASVKIDADRLYDDQPSLPYFLTLSLRMEHLILKC